MYIKWERANPVPVIIKKSCCANDGQEYYADYFILNDDGTFSVYARMSRDYNEVLGIKYFHQITLYFDYDGETILNESVYVYDEKEDKWVILIGRDNMRDPVVFTKTYDVIKKNGYQKEGLE